MTDHRPQRNVGKWLSWLGILCALPVVITYIVPLLFQTGATRDDGVDVLMWSAAMLGLMSAVVLFIPGLVFGIAGALLQRTPFSWIALLISMMPAAVVALESYSIYQYETVDKPKAADTHRVLYSYEVLTKNADGSAARLRGGSGGSGIREDLDDWVPPNEGDVYFVPQRLIDDQVTFRVYWPDLSTSELRLALGERQEIWGPANQRGLRLTLDVIDDKRATIERLFMQAKEDHRDPVYALVDALSSPDSELARDAAWQLNHMGQGEAAVPVIVDRLRDARPLVRSAAAKQIRELGPQAKAAVPTLIDLLTDEDETVRGSAVTALAVIGSEANVAAPALRQLRDSYAGRSPQSLDWALERVGRVSEAEIPNLIEALKAEEKRLREAHQSRLASRVSGSIEALEGGDDAIRIRVLDEAIRVGLESKESLAALIDLLKTGAPDVRLKAARAIGQYGESAVTGVPALTESLRDEDSRLRETAARTLGLVGPAASVSAPALETALQDPSAAVRVAAALALWRVEHDSTTAVASLVQLLETNRAKEVKFSATQALREIGSDAAPQLIDALQNPTTQSGAQEALSRMGPPAIPALIEGLKDSGRIGGSCVAALCGIGPPAVQPVTEALKHEDPRIRAAAASSLSYFPNLPDETITALGDALEDSDARVRDTANRTLRKFTDQGDQRAMRVLHSALNEFDAIDPEAKER